jgi:DNA-binding HxlR family transcriptional regulator
VRRRELDGCPVAGALQVIGDKWTMLIVRDLASGRRRTTELIDGLFPISSRTLVDRLRDMEKDDLVERFEYGGLPQRVEYSLTERGRMLLPLLDALRIAGEALACNECDDRKNRLGFYCEICPLNAEFLPPQAKREPAPIRRPERDDSIVLL